MKRYDENLRDNADKIIKFYYRRTKLGYRIIVLLSILLIICIITIFKFKIDISTSIEEKNTYKTILDNQQTLFNMKYSIEHSIGYWTLNIPNEVNDTLLLKFLQDNNAWYPEILLKQAKLESANYTSNIYKTNNNLYGMKKAYKRASTQMPSNNSYAQYKNWCLSVLDRLLWDIYTFKEKPTEEEYLKSLSSYAEDPKYINKLK